MKRPLVALVALVALAAVPATAAADGSIMVLRADAGRADAEATAAVVRGARAPSVTVTAGSASLADVALMAGCDPAEASCLETVAGQLGVEQLVIVDARKDGSGTVVDVVATRRGQTPARRSFALGADRRASLAEVEAGMPALIGRPGAAPVDGGPADRVATASTHPSRAPLVVAIGGGILAGAGFVLWGLAASTQQEIDDAPAATAEDLAHLADLEDTGRTYAAAGNGLVIGGALAGIAGLAWMYWAHRQEQRSLRVAPVAGAQVGLALEASW